MTRPFEESHSYCQAVRCRAEVPHGSPFCLAHWQTLPEDLRRRLAAAMPLPPRLLFASLDRPGVVELLELVADAIAAVARAESRDEWSTYRWRAQRWRTAESLARRPRGGPGRDAAAEDDGITYPAPGARGEPAGAAGSEGGGP